MKKAGISLRSIPVNRAHSVRADRSATWGIRVCANWGVDLVAAMVHIGMGPPPHRKRLNTLAFYKASKKSAEFFESWPADSDAPADRLFGRSLEEIEKTTGYDPEDAAPWAWNLRAGLFEKDVGWSALLDLLCERGPAVDDR